MALQLASTAFAAGGEIPLRHTCQGDDPDAPDLGTPTKVALEAAMKGHVIAQAELVGTYQKR